MTSPASAISVVMIYRVHSIAFERCGDSYRVSVDDGECRYFDTMKEAVEWATSVVHWPKAADPDAEE
ncbi:MAG: hypothetical protein Q4F31_05370 [Eubacteriales bacterium]|nr:hypothetical protein [Eubacteriales bacterium]